MLSLLREWRTWADIGLLAVTLGLASMFLEQSVFSVYRLVASVGIPPDVYLLGLFGIAIVSVFATLLLLTLDSTTPE